MTNIDPAALDGSDILIAVALCALAAFAILLWLRMRILAKDVKELQGIWRTKSWLTPD